MEEGAGREGKGIIEIPNKNLAQTTRRFPINEFLSAGELNVHIRIHTDEAAFVFRLSPFEANYYRFVDSELLGGLDWVFLVCV